MTKKTNVRSAKRVSGSHVQRAKAVGARSVSTSSRPTWFYNYAKLIVDHGIHPITSEAQHKKALREIDKMMQHGGHDRATCTAIDVFAKLIEDYESKKFPTPKVAPDAMLAHLLETRETSQATVAKATGIPRSTISAVLAGRRSLSLDAIRRICKHFHVSADVFIH